MTGDLKVPIGEKASSSIPHLVLAFFYPVTGDEVPCCSHVVTVKHARQDCDLITAPVSRLLCANGHFVLCLSAYKQIANQSQWDIFYFSIKMVLIREYEKLESLILFLYLMVSKVIIAI